LPGVEKRGGGGVALGVSSDGELGFPGEAQGDAWIWGMVRRCVRLVGSGFRGV